MLRLFFTLVYLAPANLVGAQTFEIEGSDGTICSAFAYSKSLIATAAHCTLGSQNFSVMGEFYHGSASLHKSGQFENHYLNEDEKTGQDVSLLESDALLPNALKRTKRDAKLGERLIISPAGSGYRYCTVLATYGEAYDLACEVEDGWSGAPVLINTIFGGQRVIGMISGRVGQPRDGIAVMVHVRALSKLLD
jgi:hypothetical protein